MITGHDILVLSTQDWDALPTRKHHWARRFAQQGNRVLYVEQQMHWAGWLYAVLQEPGSKPAVAARLWQWLLGPRPVADNLWVFTLPLVLPFFQMAAGINRINNLLLAPLLRWATQRLGFRDVILWTYTPHSGDFVGRLGERLTVYECVDEFSAARGLVRSATIAALERDLLAKAELVIVTHPTLLASKSPIARRVALVSNGADIEHFTRANARETPIASAVAALPKPVIGFHGWIQYWVDFELIAYAARAHPDWSFALVGPVEPLARVDKVRELANVHFLGRQPYAELPRYVAGFDVCINPFVLGALADAVSPIKLYEYLASGKPVVSVDMPAAREFAALMPLTRTPEEFVVAIEQQLRQNQNGRATARRAARQAAVAEHSWAARFRQVQALLHELTSG